MKHLKCLSLAVGFLVLAFVTQGTVEASVKPPPPTQADADAAYAALDGPYTWADTLYSDSAIFEAGQRQKLDSDAFKLMGLANYLANGSPQNQADLVTFLNVQQKAATGLADTEAAKKVAYQDYKDGNWEVSLGDKCYANEDWSGAVAHYKEARDCYLACICDYQWAAFVLQDTEVDAWQGLMEAILYFYGWDGSDLNDF